MGLWGFLWFSKAATQLEAFADTLKDEKDAEAVRRTIELLKENEQKQSD